VKVEANRLGNAPQLWKGFAKQWGFIAIARGPKQTARSHCSCGCQGVVRASCTFSSFPASGPVAGPLRTEALQTRSNTAEMP
jgi:hypothetical protein